MIDQLSDLFPYIFASTLVSLFGSPILVWLSRRAGLLDLPGSAPHKIHASPIPLAGGPVLGLAVLLVSLGLRSSLTRELVAILIGLELMMVWGAIDDLRSLKPRTKFTGQFLLAAFVLSQGVAIHITQLEWLNYGLTLFWLIGLTNAFNFVDSMDGLAVGLGGIASAFFMLVTIDSAQPHLAIFSAILLGASIGAYFLCAAPAKMFLGDSGAQLLGFALACLGIAYTPAQAGLPQSLTWFTPILVLGVPIFDMVLVVSLRMINKQPVYLPGRDHSYHRLLRWGLDATRSVLAMQFTAIFLGLLAFILLQVDPLAANLTFGVVVLIGMTLVFVFQRKGLAQDP